MKKRCYKCTEEKDLDQFSKGRGKDGLACACKACTKIYSDAHYQKNKERVLARQKTWREAHPEEAKARGRNAYHANKEEIAQRRKCKEIYPSCTPEARHAYLAKNREKINGRAREIMADRRKNDQWYRWMCKLSAMIKGVMKRGGVKKPDKKINLIQCSAEELWAHLERQFESGMTWQNHGNYRFGGPMTWHIDHIVPITAFDLDDLEQQKRCNHWSNLRPLWAVDNISKGNKITEQRYWDEVDEQWKDGISPQPSPCVSTSLPPEQDAQQPESPLQHPTTVRQEEHHTSEGLVEQLPQASAIEAVDTSLLRPLADTE